MTVDITGVATVVRRLDESSTLRSFAAVLAILYVALSLTTIGVLIPQVVEFGFLEGEDRTAFVAALVAASLGSFAPLSFIAMDWVARKPWRHVSAIVGAAIGGLGTAALAALLGGLLLLVTESAGDYSTDLPVPALVAGAFLLVLLTWLLAPSPRVRGAALAVLLVAPALLSFGFVAGAVERSEEGPSSAVIQTLLALLLGSFAAWVVVRAVLVRVVLSGDRPRALFLGDLRTGGFWRRFALLSGLPSSLWRAAALATVPFWAFTLSRPLVYLGAALISPDLLLLLDPWAQIPLGLALLAFGHALFADAKRLSAREPWSPQERYEQPPILFLRSFEDDQIAFTVPRWRLFRRWLQLWSFRRNADEVLIDEMAQYGPVVALGRPGEQTPPYGAHRYYSSDARWKDTITDTARRAQAIVIGAGSTPGVLWEYRLLAHERLLGKTLLLFPPAHAGESEAALEAFVKATASADGLRAPGGCGLVALLPTENGPLLLTAKASSGAACLVALRAHFQRADVADLADPASDFRGPASR